MIFVTTNYRLGELGFLDIPGLTREDPAAAGDYGLLDQQAALKWVQTNIKAFGGDPKQVTVAGQSAGGASICQHLSSPTARGLFQRAIIMSGFCNLSQTRAQAEATGTKFAHALGCTDPNMTVACLRQRSPAQLLAAQKSIGITPPVVGGPAFPDPAHAIASGKFNQVPVMFGQTHDENRLFVFGSFDATGHPVTAAQYPALIKAAYSANANKVLAQYPVKSYSSPSIAYATVGSDDVSCTRRQVEGQLAHYVPTYAYEFADENTPQFYSIYRLQLRGEPARSFPFRATHVDDLPYLFDYLGHTLPFSDDELELSDQMIQYWSTFVASGDPNATFVPSWPRYSTSVDEMMLLRAPGTGARTGFAADHKCQFWNAIHQAAAVSSGSPYASS